MCFSFSLFFSFENKWKMFQHSCILWRERDFHDELEKVGRRGFEKGRGGGRRREGEGREYREMSSGPLIDSWGRLPRRDKE